MADMPDNVDEAKGRGKQILGDATGDKDLKAEGKKDETAGKVKDAVGDLVDKVKGD
jgi:uncharacterized protein YjbJ (UPF0337 family)